MRIIAEGTTTIGAGATRLIPEGPGAGQLPGATKIVGMLVRANATLTAAALVGLANPQHYIGTTDLKGFTINHTGRADELNVSGTQNDVVAWTAYGP